ncbi:cyclic nucleotide-binding protein [Nostoc sp. 3335mG]|nr:cyclic nucleotide-binding protein [Nostoc sp. 3335mG]
MSNPLATKLASFAAFSPEDSAALDKLCRTTFTIRAGRDLIRIGDRPEQVFLLLDGWACRYKDLPDGRRQILAYLIPGDLCDPHIFIFDEMDHSIRALGDARVAAIPKQVILDLTQRYPSLARGFWWSALVDEAISREWLVNVAQRDSYTRMAHLFCEMWMRMCQVGLANDGRFDLPLTQEQLGDTLGITPIHVNRVLQRMRAEGLISTGRRQLTIHDVDALQEAAEFDPRYLHLDARAPA